MSHQILTIASPGQPYMFLNNFHDRGCILHLDLRDGKIWLQHNGTENDIAAELVEMGAAKSDRVIGFGNLFILADRSSIYQGC